MAGNCKIKNHFAGRGVQVIPEFQESWNRQCSKLARFISAACHVHTTLRDAQVLQRQ